MIPTLKIYIDYKLNNSPIIISFQFQISYQTHSILPNCNHLSKHQQSEGTFKTSQPPFTRYILIDLSHQALLHRLLSPCSTLFISKPCTSLSTPHSVLISLHSSCPPSSIHLRSRSPIPLLTLVSIRPPSKR